MMSMNETRELRREMVEKARPTAEQYLNDARYDWLRPLGRRRLLVVAAGAVIAALSLALWFDAPRVVSLILMAAGFGAYSLLKWSVRAMADLPEELIDERMNAVRNRQYRLAYSLLSSVTVVVLFSMWIATDASRIAWEPAARHLESLFWGFMFSSVCLPSMLVAWTEPEL